MNLSQYLKNYFLPSHLFCLSDIVDDMESFIGKKIDEVATPALLVDKSIVENNCRNMIERAKSMGNVKLRGQTKTHKTVEGGIIQTGGTKKCLVVSTLNEAELYANAGFEDILYGYPLLKSHMKRNYLLTQKLNEYHVIVVNMEGVDILCETTPPPNKKWSVFLKVDCGYPRTGIPADDENCLNGREFTQKGASGAAREILNGVSFRISLIE